MGKAHSALAGRIMESAKPPTERIEAWGVTIELRGLMLGDRSELLTHGYTGDKERQPLYVKFYPMLLRACCFDPDTGEKVFDGVSDADINQLSPKEVDRVARACLTLSGMSESAQSEIKNGSGGTATDTSSTS